MSTGVLKPPVNFRLPLCILRPSLSSSHSSPTLLFLSIMGWFVVFVAGSSVAVGMVFDPLGGLYVYCSYSLLKVKHTLI